jgi:hypothetical protein
MSRVLRTAVKLRRKDNGARCISKASPKNSVVLSATIFPAKLYCRAQDT